MTIQASSNYGADYRVYAGPLYDTLLTAGITTSLSGWTAPTTGTPVGWTNITARTHWEGQLVLRLQGSSITWEAELSGENYDEDYLGVGRALVMWRRYWTPADGWLSWAIEFVGQVIVTDDVNTYKNGKEWRRTIGGADVSLARINAPPLSAGPINVLADATITVKDDDILANPAVEMNSGEFVGEVVSVDPSNIVDGKLGTVFISDSAPDVGGAPANPAGEEDGEAVVSEVFFTPVQGWALSNTWWVEIYNWRNQDLSGITLYAASWSGPNPTDYGTQASAYISQSIPTGAFAILCANRVAFDAYTGGAPGAAWVADVGEFAPSSGFTIHPSDGYVTTGGTGIRTWIIWAPTGSTRQPPGLSATPTFNSASTSTYSNVAIRRQMDALAFTAASLQWLTASHPAPGAMTPNRGGVALKIELAANTHTLLQSVAASGSTVVLDNYVGMPYSGSALVDVDIFSYTGLTASGLTGVTGVDSDHVAGAQVYPFAAGAAQTGYPLRSITHRRRRPPYLQNWQMYWSADANVRQYQEDGTGWREDYYDLAHTPAGGNQAAQISHMWNEVTGEPYLWTRTILLVVDRMTDGGRVKLNEVTAELGQMSITDPDTTVTPITETTTVLGEATARSAALAHYLFVTHGGYAENDFVDQSESDAHQAGVHKISITPLTNVFDDLARQTGCLVYYSTDGKVYWLDDPWWPLRTVVTNTFNLTNNDTVDEIVVRDRLATLDYIILNATSLQSDMPCALRAVYPPPAGGTEPPTSAQVEELSNYTVAKDILAQLVAEREYRKRTQLGTCDITMRGIFNIRPGQVIGLTADYGRGATEAWQWQVVEVAYQRTGGERQRRLLQKLTLRLWAKGVAPA